MSTATPYKPSESTYNILVASYLVYAFGVGYYVATRPNGEWRDFSWHPFLMTFGLVGCVGVASVTKKMGGYTNTKNHGMLANFGLLLAFVSFYKIYSYKSAQGRDHFSSYHSQGGLLVLILALGPAMAGTVFLHPDFGIDKTNKLYRKVHKLFARVIITMAWLTALVGVSMVTTDIITMAIVALPLVALFPFTLI